MSIVIPVYQEKNLDQFIMDLRERLKFPNSSEIIISAAGERSEHISESKLGCVMLFNEAKGRARQMNEGFRNAEGEILYFLHADTIPPFYFDEKIRLCLTNPNNQAGCFRMKFDGKHWLLNFYSFFTRFGHDVFHGGDASLFVRRKVFEELNGFDENHLIMEDYDMVRKLKRSGGFVLLKEAVTTSARRYRENGLLRLQCLYFRIQLMYRLGVDPHRIRTFYQKKIK